MPRTCELVWIELLSNPLKPLSDLAATALIVLAVILVIVLFYHEPIDTFSNVESIQQLLQKQNYYHGEVDGIVGPDTRSALRKFQRQTGIDFAGMSLNEVLESIAKTDKTESKVQSSAQISRPQHQATSYDTSNPGPSLLTDQDKLIPYRKPSRDEEPDNPTSNQTPSRAEEPTAQPTTTAEQILAVQRVLSNYGYGQIKPSGILDDTTSTAIKKFEREWRLPITGQVTGRLLDTLAVMTGHPLK